MLVDTPLSPSLSLAEYNTTDLSEYLNTDLFGPSIEGESPSSSSSASSPQSASLLTPPQAPPSPSFTDVYDSPSTSSTLFSLLEDELKLDVQPSASPFQFLSRYEEQPEPMGIDPQLMATSAEDPVETFKEEEKLMQPEPQPEPKQEKLMLTIAPFKAGGHGKSRKGTVVNGGVSKRSVTAPTQVATPVVVSKEKENIDDDDDLPADWRPPPEVFAKMSSKEKRQLRNKISARNFRVRRKEYISTLELDIAERDRLLQSIRDELGSTQSENVALRQEIAALKKALLEGRSNTELTTEDIPVLNLPPPGPIPTPTPAATVSHATSSASLVTANTQKDVASPRSGSFWGGASRMGVGITPVHTVLIPEMAWGKSENINPALNAEKRVKTPLVPGFDGFTDSNFFTMKNLDMYRMHLWSKMASQQIPQQQSQDMQTPPSSAPSSPPTPNNPSFSPSPFINPSLPLYSTPLHGLASFMGPKYFQTSHKANVPSPPPSPPMMSKTLGTVLSGKHSTLLQGGLAKRSTTPVPPMKEQEQALVAALAGQTLLKRLGGAFWDAFSGTESSSSRKIDADKVRRVLEGKAVVKIVDVDVEPRKEVGRKVSVSENCKDSCSVTAILEESMRSLTLGKK
ncbi:hypothetical protein DFS33DRAFT_1454559 [Desarmillaria ectypa]|nr:hypothetical protein DFS33DRAFT_1454559 [Desarmillaria ectypa]